MRQNQGKKYLRYVGAAAVMLMCGLGALNGTTAEAKTLKNKDFEYRITKKDTVVIKKYIGKKVNVKVPETLAGKPVVKLGGSSFEETKVEKVMLPKRLKEIGSGAFYKCMNLKTITGTEGLKRVGEYAFWGCKNFTSIGTVSLDKIERYAFYNCKKLGSEITISDKCERVRLCAFFNCKNVELTIPATVKEVEYMAFAFCQKITKITLRNSSDGINNINISAYAGCQNIKEIDLQDDSGNLVLENGILYNKDKTMVKYVLPTYTGSMDFLNNVKSLGEFCMTGFNGETVVFPETLQKIRMGVLYGAKTKAVDWPSTVTRVPEYAFSHSGLTKITIPEGVERVKDKALFYCTKLEVVSFPRTMERFMGGFRGNKSLKAILVAEGNKKFYSEDGVLFTKLSSKEYELEYYPPAKKGTSYTMPNNVRMGRYCFENLKYLRNIKITKNTKVKFLGKAFLRCNNVRLHLPQKGMKLDPGEKVSTDPLFTDCTNCKAILKKGTNLLDHFKKWKKKYGKGFAYKVVK